MVSLKLLSNWSQFDIFGAFAPASARLVLVGAFAPFAVFAIVFSFYGGDSPHNRGRVAWVGRSSDTTIRGRGIWELGNAGGILYIILYMRYFIKLNSKGVPVNNSLVFATRKPRVGRWMEIYKMCKDEECRCIPEDAPKGYYQKVKYYYTVDDDCTPIPGSNISAYCLPQPGNFFEFYPPCLINPCDQPTTSTTTSSTTTSTTTTTTANINSNLSFYYALPICLVGGGDSSCAGVCNLFNSLEYPCTTFYVSPLCYANLSVGCILYFDNTYTSQVTYSGYYSDGIKCYYLTHGVITSISNCPAPPTTTTTTFPHITDCTGIETVRPPVSVNGTLITATHTGNIFEPGLGSGWGICSGHTEDFTENAWLGYHPFTYTINFSNPVNNIALRIGVMGVPTTETFTFTTNAGTPTITSNFSCHAVISGNQIIGGPGSSFGPISGGGGEFVITAPSSYTSITISGPGDGTGSLFGIVCSSI